MKLKLLRFIIFAGTICATFGCSPYQVSKKTPESALMPDRFSSGNSEISREPYQKWWQSFNDPVLNALVDEGLKNNLDLKIAWTRLAAAAALTDKAGALLVPNIDLDQSASRQQVYSRQETGPVNLFSTNLKLSYEVDIWKRIYSLKNAAKNDFKVTEAELAATAHITASSIVRLWINLKALKAQINVLQEQQELSQTFLDLIESRFTQGLSNANAVYQQREELASTKAQIPLFELEYKRSERALAALLGRKISDINFYKGISPSNNLAVSEHSVIAILDELEETPNFYQEIDRQLGPLPALGLPADLLKNRPDLLAAIARVEATDYRVAAAIAARFPSLRIGAAYGSSENEVEKLFSNWIWSIAGNVLTPLIDGGSRRADVKIAKANLEAHILNFEKVLLQALQEVENAVSTERYQKMYLLELINQYRNAKLALQEARRRYARGLDAYLNVLIALRVEQSSKRQLINAVRDLILNRNTLYQALGTSWKDIPKENGN